MCCCFSLDAYVNLNLNYCFVFVAEIAHINEMSGIKTIMDAAFDSLVAWSWS